MPEEIKITHVVFNKEDIKFTTSFVNGYNISIGKIELRYFNAKAIEPYTRRDTLHDTMTITDIYTLESKLSNVLGPVLKKFA